MKSSITALHTRSHNHGPWDASIHLILSSCSCKTVSLYSRIFTSYTVLCFFPLSFLVSWLQPSVSPALLPPPFKIHPVVLSSLLIAVLPSLTPPGFTLPCLTSALTMLWESLDFLSCLQQASFCSPPTPSLRPVPSIQTFLARFLVCLHLHCFPFIEALHNRMLWHYITSANGDGFLWKHIMKWIVLHCIGGIIQHSLEEAITCSVMSATFSSSAYGAFL